MTSLAPKPVNVLMSASAGLMVADLAEMGVRRVSVGTSLAETAWTGFVRAARETAKEGSFVGFDGSIPFAEPRQVLRQGLETAQGVGVAAHGCGQDLRRTFHELAHGLPFAAFPLGQSALVHTFLARDLLGASPKLGPASTDRPAYRSAAPCAVGPRQRRTGGPRTGADWTEEAVSSRPWKRRSWRRARWECRRRT